MQRLVAARAATSALAVRRLASKTTGDSAPAGSAAKLKSLFKEYGMIGVGTHVALSAVTYSSCYAAISMGCPVSDLVGWIGLEPDKIAASTTLGTAAIAYLAYKSTIVIRAPATLAATPIVAKIVRRMRADRA